MGRMTGGCCLARETVSTVEPALLNLRPDRQSMPNGRVRCGCLAPRPEDLALASEPQTAQARVCRRCEADTRSECGLNQG